jgi:hypothetical protein
LNKKDKKNLITYQELAGKMSRKANAALLKSIGNDWTVAKESVTEAARLEIVAVNRLRLAGIKIQEASGHEQVGFEWFHKVEADLPTGMHFNAVKFCVHLARKLENAVTTLDEARSARQMMFEALELATAPKRLEGQNSHDRNPWSDFVSGVSSLTSLFAKLEEEPMGEWDTVKLTKFVQTTDPIVDKNREARALLAK